MPAADGSKRLAYRLTDKGESLRPVLAAIRDWGLAWEPGAEARLESEATASQDPPPPIEEPEHFADLG